MNQKGPPLVLSDFDGTLTVGGLSTQVFWEILEFLKSKNCPLLIVTGRPLCWGHFFIEQFGLWGIIAEGGGSYTYKDEKGFIQNIIVTPQENVDTLKKVTENLLREFPEVYLTGDSLGRVTDRAIELQWLEEHPLIQEQIENFLTSHKVSFSYSQVHLNFWVGDFSKAKTSQMVLEKHFPEIPFSECLFFGDGPNDQSLFDILPQSVGVSNIEKVLDKLEFPPKVVLRGKENEGAHGVLNYLKESWK
jgi:HAD superfamily hydrolase (TIGR01484 family)